MFSHSIALLPLICLPAISAPTGGGGGSGGDGQSQIAESIKRATGGLPFNKIIAFGDDFTDDGRGSYGHNITGNPKTGQGIHLWGNNTWTDGPVAVTYMAQQLGIPVTYNYAFGSADGGQFIGSVCSNALLDPSRLGGHAKMPNGRLVPAALQQIRNYTTAGVYNKDMNNTLHFLWTGNNDMISSLGWLGRFTICSKDTLCHKSQDIFIGKVMGCMLSSINNLINAGAKHILVPNVYPRNLSPWQSLYISPDPGMIADFDGVISRFNAQLQGNITQIRNTTGVNVMYFDVNSLMKTYMQQPPLVQNAGYNYTCVDGCTVNVPGTQSNFDLWFSNTVIKKQPSAFYWMTTVMPSSTVFRSVGSAMASFLTSQTY